MHAILPPKPKASLVFPALIPSLKKQYHVDVNSLVVYLIQHSNLVDAR